MSLRMRRYPDGREELAAFCDTCGEQITELGYVIWNDRDVNDWRVVHQARCDPGRPRYSSSMPLSWEIGNLARSAGVDLDETRRREARRA